MKIRDRARILGGVCLLLFCVLTAQPCAKASSAELRDGRAVSGLVSGEAFDVHTLPEAAEDIGLTVTVSEKYANGIIVFQYGDRFGLMDGSCRILQQPDYSAVYPVYRTAEGEEQWFPNLLVLAEPSGEVGSYRIFNCRTEKLLGETYHAVGFYFGGNAQAYASYLERGNHISLEGCFLPVYRTGEGYGMLDLEGECIIACEYEDYRLVHPRRMLMDRLENGHSNELFDETGTALATWYGYSFPLSGSYHDGLACVECFVSNASEPENGAQEPVRGYVDMEGNWAFTLQENYNAYDSLRDFSEGLAAVMFEDPVSGASYPLYFDTSGNQRLCLDRLCEEVQGEFPEQDLRVEATDFHEGRAFVSFYSYGTCLAKYLLYAGGNVTRLSPEHSYEAFHFNSALVDAAYGDAGSNLLSRWGYLLMDDRYSSVRYLGGNNARWAMLQERETGLYAFLSLPQEKLTQALYEACSSSDLTLCNGNACLKVTRSGKVGVLDPEGREMIPCSYDSIVMAGERQQYFLARYYEPETGAFRCSVFAPDGSALSSPGQFEADVETSPSGVSLAYGFQDGQAYLIAPDGRIIAIPAEYMPIEGAVGAFYLSDDGLVSAERIVYRQEADFAWEIVEQGYLDSDGAFYPLAQDLRQINVGSPIHFTHGTSQTVSRYDADTGCYADVIFRNRNYRFTDWVQLPPPPTGTAELSVVSLSPGADSKDNSRYTEQVEITFNQEIVLMDRTLVQVTSSLGTPGCYAVQDGNRLIIRFTELLNEGETYTVSVAPAAVMGKDAVLSVFEGYSYSFKVAGISAEELLTYYPQYLELPEEMQVRFEAASDAVSNAMETYDGENGLGSYFASLFYATKHYNDVLAGHFSDHGISEQMQEDVLQMFIAKVCLDNTTNTASAKQSADALQVFLKLLNPTQSQELMVDCMRDYAAAAGYDFTPQELNSIAIAVKGLVELEEFNDYLDAFTDVSSTFNDVFAEYTASLMTYLYLDRSTAESLLNNLSPASELYRGLKAHVDAVSGEKLRDYIWENTRSDAVTGICKAGIQALQKSVGGVPVKVMNFGLAIARSMYTAFAAQADAEQYIKTIMFSSYVFSLNEAHLNIRLEMMRTCMDSGATTPAQRREFEDIYRAKQAAWVVLLEESSKLFQDPGHFNARECKNFAAVIRKDCLYEEYIRACKDAVPNSVHRQRLERYTEGERTVVTGYQQAAETMRAAQLASEYALGAVSSVHVPAPVTVLSVPGVLDGSAVEAIAPGAFAGLGGVRSVSVEGCAEGTTIGAGAFRNCVNLEHVSLGSVSSVGAEAFSGCALRQIVIPQTVTEIGENAFLGVSFVYGSGEIAKAHAASICAEYVDITLPQTELQIAAFPEKISYRPGEALDLSGLELSSEGTAVELQDCCVAPLPSAMGPVKLRIQYRDAAVFLPLIVENAVSDAGHQLILSDLQTTQEQSLVLSGRVVSSAASPVVAVGYYAASGQLIDALFPTPDGEGNFSAEHSAADVSEVRLFLLSDGTGLLPVVPVLRQSVA